MGSVATHEFARSGPFNGLGKAALFILRLSIAGMVFFPAGAASGQDATNETCLLCHQDKGLEKIKGALKISLYVDEGKYARSVHGRLACTACHTDAGQIPHPSELRPVACGSCHGEASEVYERGVHGQARGKGVSGAAACKNCHGHHDVLPARDPASSVYPLNLPRTCGACHGNPEEARRLGIREADAYELYMDSVHGRALSEDGLLVAANCTSCHGYHEILAAADPRSRVHRSNIPETCGECHAGILDVYRGSIHGQLASAGLLSAPVCIDCHTAHEIRRTETEAWKLEIVRECGTCHAESERTFRDTFHGQVTALGFTRVARCSDCHGSHQILPVRNPKSSVHRDHLVATCRKCHAGANVNFAQYDPHADPKDKDRNPVLYYASLFMTLLLAGVFFFFGVHVLLWALRATLERSRKREPKRDRPEFAYYFRFSLGQRLLHGFLIFSFLGSVATGMPLLYNASPWAAWIARGLGGFSAMGVFHRFLALILTALFISHVIHLTYRIVVRRERGLLWGPDSLMPQPGDFTDLYRNIRWFVGAGPKPRFGRYTYWEKFDYLAVFWGMAMIGVSGFVLWFHGLFSNWIPGWWFNVALLVHGEEALLAAGFIFTIHYFNTHLRPEKFPMDLVMFTGRVGEAELREERPREYDELSRTGELSRIRSDPPQRWLKNFGRILGAVAVSVGLLLFALIVIAVFGR